MSWNHLLNHIELACFAFVQYKWDKEQAALLETVLLMCERIWYRLLDTNLQAKYQRDQRRQIGVLLCIECSLNNFLFGHHHPSQLNYEVGN